MLINTTRGIVFDPSSYRGRLCVCIDTNDRETCGLFSGRHDGFRDESEMEQRMPTILDDTLSGVGSEVFEIVRARVAPSNQTRRYNYVAISWENNVYVTYPKSWELTLTDHGGELWDVHFGGVQVILPDFGDVSGAP